MGTPVGLSPEKWPHGTRARYVGLKCRCTLCRQANTAYYHANQAKAKERLPATSTPAKGPCPGVEGEPCEKGLRLRSDSKGGICHRCREKLISNPLVGTEKVIAHLQALRAQGVGLKSVRAASDVPLSTLQDILSGKNTKVRRHNERRILEVDAGARGDASLVDAKPTWKLVRQMLKWGYPKSELAKRLGFTSPQLQLQKKRIIARSALAIEKLYRTLQEEQAIMEEGKRRESLCELCGRQHTAELRQERLRKLLPAMSYELREAWPCTWPTSDSGEKRFYRDLKDVGAVRAPGGLWEIRSAVGCVGGPSDGTGDGQVAHG